MGVRWGGGKEKGGPSTAWDTGVYAASGGTSRRGAVTSLRDWFHTLQTNLISNNIENNKSSFTFVKEKRYK